MIETERNSKMKRPEILAPAGSIESMHAAINAGCDAVYIGGNLFGARAYANNLDSEQLLRAMDFAHIHGKQMYLTVNTLVKPEEMQEQLYQYLRPLYEHGLDAVIVQDVGAIQLIHESFKELPIHASTQMTLTMAQGANLLSQYGVTRFVPARELSLTELIQMRKDTSLEIEAFVHGALCYCYSGQCLMSSMNGNRSGNRGRCAQPCRMEYSAKQESEVVSSRDNSYLLSPKDMCTLTMTAQMIEAGINSFKIEGRMKRPEYAAGVTYYYKTEVERYFSLGAEKYREFHESHPQVMKQALTDLQDLYNRGGFSTGYYNQHNGKNMMSMHRPNHSGVFVGTVKNKKGIQAGILLSEAVHAQDVLEFRHNGAAAYEFTVKEENKKGNILTTNTMPKSQISIGDEVYRTKNGQLLSGLYNQYLKQDVRVPVQGTLKAVCGQPLELTVSAEALHVSGKGNTDTIADIISVTKTSAEVQKAQKQPMQEQSVREKLSKTNSTVFLFEQIHIQMQEDVFFPVSQLNELRRQALEELEQKIAFSYHREIKEESRSVTVEQEVNSDTYFSALVTTMQQCKAACEADFVKEIIYDLAQAQESDLQNVASFAVSNGKKFLVRLPYILRNFAYSRLVQNKDLWSADTISGYVVKNFEELAWLKELGIKKQIRMDGNMYVMNQKAKEFYAYLGIHEFTAPSELCFEELKQLDVRGFDLIVYGYQPLMVSAQCVRKNTLQCQKNSAKPLMLISKTQKGHMVRTNCSYCYNTIYDSECFSLLEESDKVKSLAPRCYRLEFLAEDYLTTKKVLQDFYAAYILGNSCLKEEKETTKGHFMRPVL